MNSTDPGAASTDGPLVWGLLGRKAGDNQQVRQLVEALGCRHAFKQLAFNQLSLVPNILLPAGRITLTQATDELSPPWPDLVIAAGRRSVPAARWIKRRTAGRACLVQLGRPQAPLGQFDLIVTTPQYGLPARDNVLRNILPFQRAPAVPEQALAAWRESFSPLPRPLIAFLVGGSAWPYKLDAATAKDIGIRASKAARTSGGTLLVSTSPRTGASATEVLKAALTPPDILNDWRDPKPGFYQSSLHLADRLIVTGESVSMMAEAIRAARSVEIYELPRRTDPATRLTRWAESPVFAGTAHLGFGLPLRNAGKVQEALIDHGVAAPFGAAPPDKNAAAIAQDEMKTTVEQTRALLGIELTSAPANLRKG